MRDNKLVFCFILALGLTACKNEKQVTSPQPRGVPVSIIEIQSKPQSLIVELPGRSKAFLEAEVRPQVTGIIIHRAFTEGGEVTQGQSLYKIDAATYEAALVSANAALTRAQATLESAKTKANSYRELSKTSAISKQDFNDADAAYKEAAAGVTVAEANVNTAKINLEYTEVKAPISGRIGKSSVTAGALVTANQATALATIQQLDPINVDVTQSSAQLLRLKSKLKKGTLTMPSNADVQLVLEDGTHYEHNGRLRFAEVSVDENTGSVILRAQFPNPDGLLLPGMYVRALLDTGTDPHAILVPQKAITRNTKGEAVAMIMNAEGKVESRVVTTAEVINNQWRITSGLTVGDKLIVEGLQKIRPGVPVIATVLNSGTDHSGATSAMNTAMDKTQSK